MMMMMMVFNFCTFCLLAIMGAGVSGLVPSVPLKNSASPGLTMPAMGLGLGGYGMDPSVGYNGYPECWMEYNGNKHVGCGKYTIEAVNKYLKLGGRRLDPGDNYGNSPQVGQAIKASSVPRKELFVLSKVGIICPFGFNETLACFEMIRSQLMLEYLDALLIHWPEQFNQTSKDPPCMFGHKEYNMTTCRLHSWRAMLQIQKTGGAKAVGVSNYEIVHLQEIIDAGLELPSINQCHFNPYGGAAQMPLVKFCKAHDIVYLGYSPLGIPDWHKFPGPDMAETPLKDPAVLEIAAAKKLNPAQVILAWEWSLGIPVNPRSMNETHMAENLNIYDIKITSEESAKLMACHQDTCKEDPTYYECHKES